MSMFNEYPYRNLTDLNLDWLLNAIRTLRRDVDDFVTMNAIKYADPIDWNITTQYEKNTVVIDANTGIAYLSVNAVPSGVNITRPEYWSVIFDLSRFLAAGISNLANSYEANPTYTATVPTNKGNWVMWNGTLYEALNDIHIGDRYVPNGNIKKTTVEDFVSRIIGVINTEIQNRIAADGTLQNNIDAEARARQDADGTLQNNIDAEVQARQNADTTLQDHIDAEAQARQDADGTLQEHIDAEAQARQDAINSAMQSLTENIIVNDGDSASLMTYNSTPVNNISRLSIVDGNNDRPSSSDNNPSVMISRVDDSYHGDHDKNVPQYILYDLYATMKRIATSCGYASTILGYMEDNTENGESAGGSTQSVAVSGMSYVTKNSSVWALYGDVYNKSEGHANAQACELNVHNETGVDYPYNSANPVAYPFSCGEWIVTGGNADNSFALGISTFDIVHSHWHVGEYYAPYSVTDIGVDMQATPTVNIRLHGAKTDPLSGINHQGIGIDFAGNYWQTEGTPEVGHGAIHLHDEAICFGSSGLGHIFYNESAGRLEFWFNGARRGYINMGGADHEL